MRSPLTYPFFLFFRFLDELKMWIRMRFFNPTRDWPARRVSRLSFDMVSRTLNGVAMDAPISEARVFGPADRLMTIDRSDLDLAYQALGLEVECYEECIVEFRVIMDPASRGSREHRKFKPAQLSLKGLDGSLHILSRETTEQAVMALFGRPDESGPVGEDRVHTFILGGNFIDTYHSPVSGRLMELTLSLAAEDATIS